jgi:hypothetical protein
MVYRHIGRIVGKPMTPHTPQMGRESPIGPVNSSINITSSADKKFSMQLRYTAAKL